MRSVSPLSLAALALALGLATGSAPAHATDAVVRDYMLNCQGCHLDDGAGYPARGVPRLTGYMGRFLKVPGGREFLVQVPGSAQAGLDNARLANLLNWMLARFSPGEMPAHEPAYSADEVGRLRTRPLVTVTATRAELVQRIELLTP